MKFDLVVAKNIFKGSLTYVPGLYPLLRSPTGGTDSALYCYGVWMRHLILAHRWTQSPIPKVVAELGPGDSMGASLAALISGVEKIVALDVVRHAQIQKNLHVFDELVALFKRRQAIPSPDDFPHLKPSLESYQFPHALLSDEHLARCLEPRRLDLIRRSIERSHETDSMISYRVPWDSVAEMAPASVDFIFSQAVLEHVRDLKTTYRALSLWLKPSGAMSHEIDFKSHGITKEWNGHWQYSDRLWKLTMGKRPYLLNRQPCSAHLSALRETGLTLVHTIEDKMPSALRSADFAAPFKNLSNEDATTSSLFVLSQKKAIADEPI